jgi:translation initiation factor 1A
LTENNNTNNPETYRRMRVANKADLEQFGKVTQLMGVNNIQIMCEDGKERICRIPGKMFKHIWIKPNDIVIVKLWDFQPTKGDVVWRYLGFQVTQLEKKGLLNDLYKHTHDVIGERESTRPVYHKRK